MAQWIDVAAADEIKPGGYRRVSIDDVDVAVFNIDGAFHAIEDVCTHDYETLTGGEIEGCEIICPRHGARFDITTGAALTPPAYEDLPTYEVRVVDGRIEILDDS